MSINEVKDRDIDGMCGRQFHRAVRAQDLESMGLVDGNWVLNNRFSKRLPVGATFPSTSPKRLATVGIVTGVVTDSHD